MIEVQNLTKQYGPVTAVNDVSFRVEAGEILGFLGPNGAGKTTTMRIITGFIPATEGKVMVAGYDVFEKPLDAKRRTGYLPETPPLYPDMTVREYLQFVGRIKGVASRELNGRVDESMKRARVADMAGRHCGKLSKGYRQRVGLADALLADPPVLILDEPTDGLDPGQKTETLNLLRELGRDHTIMLSSHLLSEVETLVQRVIIMRRGFVGLARKLAELEADPVIVMEVRGPVEQVKGVIETTEGVAQVVVEAQSDGLATYLVRTVGNKDLREVLSTRLARNGHGLRRLDLRRKRLQDRWNEINNMDEGQLGSQAASDAQSKWTAAAPS
jgi:ABC-2 type transport system ATP-binding protein